LQLVVSKFRVYPPKFGVFEFYNSKILGCKIQIHPNFRGVICNLPKTQRIIGFFVVVVVEEKNKEANDFLCEEIIYSILFSFVDRIFLVFYKDFFFTPRSSLSEYLERFES